MATRRSSSTMRIRAVAKVFTPNCCPVTPIRFKPHRGEIPAYAVLLPRLGSSEASLSRPGAGMIQPAKRLGPLDYTALVEFVNGFRGFKWGSILAQDVFMRQH